MHVVCRHQTRFGEALLYGTLRTHPRHDIGLSMIDHPASMCIGHQIWILRDHIHWHVRILNIHQRVYRGVLQETLPRNRRR